MSLKRQPDENYTVKELLQRLAALITEGLAYRLDLFAVEIKEERNRFLAFGLGLVIILILSSTAWLMINVAILAGFWAKSAVWTAIILAVLNGGLAFFIYTRLVAAAHNSERPFNATRDEFLKDKARFAKKAKDDDHDTD